jgi:hypothetical protein
MGSIFAVFDKGVLTGRWGDVGPPKHLDNGGRAQGSCEGTGARGGEGGKRFKAVS